MLITGGRHPYYGKYKVSRRRRKWGFHCQKHVAFLLQTVTKSKTIINSTFVFLSVPWLFSWLVQGTFLCCLKIVISGKIQKLVLPVTK